MISNNTLLIYFTDNTGDTVYWASIDEKGKKTFQSIPCLLTECPKPHPHSQTEIIVLFPAEEMLFTTIALPLIKPSQQAQAALYALEDKLAEDVQALHAKVFHSPATVPLSAVGIIRKSLLENWLEKLSAAGFHPTLLLPDIFALPYEAGQWTVLRLNQRILVRTADAQGFATSIDYHELFLNKQTSSDASFVQKSTEESLAFFLKEIQAKKRLCYTLNLLQGKYRQKTPWYRLKKRWQLPLILCGIWLSLMILVTVWKYHLLNAENKTLESQITALYRQVYPASAAVISPQLRIERELAQLKKSQQQQLALPLLAQTGNILKQMKITIKSLDFRHDTLRVNIKAPDFQTVEKMIHLLQQKHLQVQQSDAARSSDGVTATLSLQSLREKK